jgi:hypothetical protein
LKYEKRKKRKIKSTSIKKENMKRTIKNAIISKYQKEKNKRLKERQHNKKKEKTKTSD